MAAFVFGVVLYILIRALGTGEAHKNLKFRTLTITVVIGDLLSILDNIFRDSGKFPTPVIIRLLLLLLVFFANVLLTYYMALYMEGFFGEFKYKRLFFYVNSVLVVSAGVFTAVLFIFQIVCRSSEAIIDTVPIWTRVILGYAYELYFLIYAVTLFIILKGTLSRRARITSMAAFAVVIGSVLFELLNTFGIGSGIMYNYFGAVIGMYIFYIGVETPDYRNLLSTVNDLNEAKHAADEANRAKSEFLANMSHEIRTPINAVLGMNEMILRESDDETILSYSGNIKNAGKTLLGLINDILDFSKIEAGKIEIVPTEYDLSMVLYSLVNMIKTRVDDKGLDLKLDFDPGIPKGLYGDEMRIKQVITNILTNAVKYTEKGSVTFSMGYEVLTEDPDHIILNVSIKDTGIGIKPEDMPRLFSEFDRLEEKRNRNIEGSGLGMSITNSYLNLMGSALKVESTYGAGSRFYFSLKQKVTSWAELGDYKVAFSRDKKEREKYEARFTAPDACVLMIDDNIINHTVFKGLIKKTLIHVDTAKSGDEGIKLAAENKYDILFIDHMMPGKDGIETLHELRASEDGPNISTPAVCLTANAISGAKEEYMKAGFDEYLTKPIDPPVLEEIIYKYLPKEKIKE
ncbi:MAG: response regulator [Lachnospiraceae bacterium]|nr:response regulator [Lachnospiraceae bacterium]